MNEALNDADLAVRLRRLDAEVRTPAPDFDYQGMLDRRAAGQAKARRRAAIARGSASVLVVLMVAVSAWRLDGSSPAPSRDPGAATVAASPAEAQPQQRLVRADTYLAIAALEDHIATIDDALSDARLVAPGGNEVARLERTRAELLDSYVRVRYADMVAANF